MPLLGQRKPTKSLKLTLAPKTQEVKYGRKVFKESDLNDFQFLPYLGHLRGLF